MGRLKAGKTPIDGYAIEKVIKNQNLNFDVLQEECNKFFDQSCKDILQKEIDKDEMSIDRCMWLCLKLGLHPEDIKATELFRDKDGITYGKQQDISDYMKSNEKPQKVTLRMIYELLEKIYELLNELRRKSEWQQ